MKSQNCIVFDDDCTRLYVGFNRQACICCIRLMTFPTVEVVLATGLFAVKFSISKAAQSWPCMSVIVCSVIMVITVIVGLHSAV